MNVDRLAPPAAGVELLVLGGELDVGTAPAAATRIEELAGQSARIVLDMSPVDFFDSAGVRLLDRLARDCAKRGGGLRIAAPPGNRARRVLELVGMSGPLVCDDVDAAVAAVLAG